MRADAWDHPDVLIGGSDAGAHLDRMCGAPYTTGFLADCLRGRQLVSLERAVELITHAPAALFGLRDRGVIAEGARADLVLLRPRHGRHRRRLARGRSPRRHGAALRAGRGCAARVRERARRSSATARSPTLARERCCDPAATRTRLPFLPGPDARIRSA